MMGCNTPTSKMMKKSIQLATKTHRHEEIRVKTIVANIITVEIAICLKLFRAFVT